jgi:hypothetical protein
VPLWLTVFVLYVMLAVVAVVDAARRPRPAWKRAGQNKTLWMLGQPLGIVLLFFGYLAPLALAIPVLYLLWIRPSIARAHT